jgi:hypothetical protein
MICFALGRRFDRSSAAFFIVDPVINDPITLHHAPDKQTPF